MRRPVPILLAALAAVFAGCGGAKPPAPEPESYRYGPSSLMHNVKVKQVVEGHMEVEIFAKEAWHSRNAEWVHGRGVRAIYYPRGRNPASLRASVARYDVKTRQLKVWDRVRVESEGTVLETEELQYDAKKGRIFTAKPVTVTRGRNVMEGTGMEADPDLGNMQVTDPHISAREPAEIKPLIEGMGQK
jgi:LPS export ABC transporter protein LptC